MPLDVNLDDGLFVTGNGVPVRSATIPPKSGAVFVSAPTSAACSPRPRVRLQTTSLGAGGLQVQVFSGLGDIRRIDVGGTANTLVSVQGGPQRASGTSSVDMPLGTTSTVVTLERAAAGAGVFAPITVHDTCGPWKTFAGRGAAS